MGLFGFIKKIIDSSNDTKQNPIPGTNNSIDELLNSPALRNSNSAFANVNFLSIINGKPLEQSPDSYYRLFERQFKIYDPLRKHKDLINAGLLIEAPMNMSISYAYKVPELKMILESRGLKKTGKKDELVQRIIEETDISLLKIRPVYILSESGKEYIRKYQYYIDVVKYLDCDMTIQMFDDMKKTAPDKSVQEIVFSVCQTLDKVYKDQKLYWNLQCNQKKKFTILIDMKNYQEAGYYAIAYMYLKLSGMTNYGIVEYENLTLDMAYENCLNTVEIPNISTLVDKCYKEYKLPFHYFKPNVTAEIITKLYNGEEVYLASYKRKSSRPSSYDLI